MAAEHPPPRTRSTAKMRKTPSHSSQHQLFCEADRSVLGCAVCCAADLVQKAGHRGSNQEMQ